MNETVALEARGVAKRYGRGALALDGLDLTVPTRIFVTAKSTSASLVTSSGTKRTTWLHGRHGDNGLIRVAAKLTVQPPKGRTPQRRQAT